MRQAATRREKAGYPNVRKTLRAAKNGIIMNKKMLNIIS